MGKKKKKKKKSTAKKEKYAKFRKEKQAGTFTEPDRTQDEQKSQREEEDKLNRFLRFNRNKPAIGPNDHKKRKLQKRLKK